jgi:hypothetical protein
MTNYQVRISFVKDAGGVTSFDFPITAPNKDMAIELAKDATYVLTRGWDGRIVVDYAVKA